MEIALINKITRICENVAVFEDMQTAIEMLGEQYIITEAKDSYGIGDICKDGKWSKVGIPDVDLEPEQNRRTSYEAIRYKAGESPLIL